MIDKKIVVVIVLFIVGGLFIYSFANPADEKEEGNNYITPGDESTDDPVTPPVVEEEPIEEEKEEPKKETVVNKKPVVKPPANNSGSNNKPTNPTAPVTPPIVKTTAADFTHIKYNGEVSEIGRRITGNTIDFGGQMEEQLPYPIHGFTNYIKFRVTSKDTVTNDELQTASVTVSSKAAGTENITSGIHIDQATGKAYVDFEFVFQKINDGNTGSDGKPTNFDNITVTVNWGYGVTQTYNILLKIELLPRTTV